VAAVHWAECTAKEGSYAQHAPGHHEALWSVLVSLNFCVLRLCVEGDNLVPGL
jgi:hypothetical protein